MIEALAAKMSRSATGFAEVSNLGRLRSLDRIVLSSGKKAHARTIRGRVLRPALSHGYHSYVLWRNHKQTTVRAHQVVALAFLGPRPEGTYACHDDGDRGNNALVNIYYGTPAQNSADARRHGTLPVGEACGAAKLTRAEAEARAAADALAAQAGA